MLKRLTIAALIVVLAAVVRAGATVTTAANQTTIACNSVATTFTFTFPAVNSGDIAVVVTDSSGTETTLTTSQYTLALNSVPTGQIWGLGGTVTYPLSGPTCPTGSLVTITRTVPLIQIIALSNQGTLVPRSVEQGLDLLTMQMQQVSTQIGKQITVAASDSAPAALPPAAQRANTALVFDANGDPIAGSIPSSGVISSIMQPVVSASSLTDARDAMGLGDSGTGTPIAMSNIGAGLEDGGAGTVRTNQQTVADSTSQAVDSTFHATQRIATGPIAYTLARANTLWNGFSFSVYAFTDVITFAPNASDSIGSLSSGTSFSVQPGSYVTLTTNAQASGTWYISSHQLGVTPGGPVIINGGIVESHASNAVTFAVKSLGGNDPSTLHPVYLVFRDATVGTGVPVIRQLVAGLSVTVPSGATLGFTDTVPGRVWLTAIDNAGSVELAVINCLNGTNIYPLQGWGIVSTTVLDTSADNPAAMYSASARTSVAYMVLGYYTWETGLAAAGTWNAAPTRIQLYGPGTPLPGMVVQTQENFTGAVATGTTAIPPDDSIPAITEGDQYMTQAITPTSAANLLRISSQAYIANSAAPDGVASALFRDSDTDALAVSNDAAAGGNRVALLQIYWAELAKATSIVTYSIRCGAASGTSTFNGFGAARKYGGTFNSFISVKEIMGALPAPVNDNVNPGVYAKAA